MIVSSATAIKWVVGLFAAGAVLAVLWLLIAAPRMQLAAERQAHAETKARHADVLRGLAEQTAEVARLVRERETRYAADAAENDARHKKELADAQATQDRFVADVRAGRVQLRHWWQDPAMSCAGDAAAAADPGRDAGRAELRAASAGRIVGAVVEADAWIRWLQSELIATRAVCGAQVTP